MRASIESLLTCTLLLAGCARQEQPKSAGPPEYFKVSPSDAGGLRGVVRFSGPKPGPKRISMDAEEACEKMQKQPVYSGQIVTGREAGLAGAFVYLKSGLEGKVFEPPSQAVVLDQRGCQFVPRVVSLQTGQPLVVKNSDPVSHNIHPQPRNNYEWNQQQSPGASDLQRKFVRPEVMIPVKCNIHAWMRSYIAVMEHPYFAVTTEKGSFSWDAVPPGRYVISAWHEGLPEQTHNVDIVKGQHVDVTFTFTKPPDQK